MNLNDLQTPCLILDYDKVSANCSAMTRRMQAHGVGLRPHMKTAKSIDVAKLALDGNPGGITVATLNEAEYFAVHGIRDICYAVCITPDKAERVAQLQSQGVQMTLITDSLDATRALEEKARFLGVTFHLLVEVDVGEHRTGVEPDSSDLLSIGGYVHESDHLSLGGVLSHAGQSYRCTDIDSIVEVAEMERSLTVMAAGRLRDAGLPCPTVSIGSTPTAVHGTSFDGITEVRAGVYTLGDCFQANIGSCSYEDIAASVLATVISHRPRTNQLVLDAGALALSKDLGSGKHGYGLVRDVHGQIIAENLHVAGVHQEHGEVSASTPIPFDQLPVGSRVRVLPNHSCMTCAMYDRYYVFEKNGFKQVWRRTNGWEQVGDRSL